MVGTMNRTPKLVTLRTGVVTSLRLPFAFSRSMSVMGIYRQPSGDGIQNITRGLRC